ncbi:hypothetical protein KY285_023373 [Solanum tuberosum]|nr:hypothetical protein KY289_023711 [Solanum tuberosum]KAH0675572.1 hypothetical protein KY285_023373 [Solanum tuberosum]
MQQRRTLHTLLSSPPLSSRWRDHAAMTATTGEAPPRLLPLLSLSLSLSPLEKPHHQPPPSPLLPPSPFLLFFANGNTDEPPVDPYPSVRSTTTK